MLNVSLNVNGCSSIHFDILQFLVCVVVAWLMIIWNSRSKFSNFSTLFFSRISTRAHSYLSTLTSPLKLMITAVPHDMLEDWPEHKSLRKFEENIDSGCGRVLPPRMPSIKPRGKIFQRGIKLSTVELMTWSRTRSRCGMEWKEMRMEGKGKEGRKAGRGGSGWDGGARVGWKICAFGPRLVQPPVWQIECKPLGPSLRLREATGEVPPRVKNAASDRALEDCTLSHRLGPGPPLASRAPCPLPLSRSRCCPLLQFNLDLYLRFVSIPSVSSSTCRLNPFRSPIPNFVDFHHGRRRCVCLMPHRGQLPRAKEPRRLVQPRRCARQWYVSVRLRFLSVLCLNVSDVSKIRRMRSQWRILAMPGPRRAHSFLGAGNGSPRIKRSVRRAAACFE